MKQDTVQLTANGNGAQPYLPSAILDDSACPLRQGEQAAVEVVDGIGLLITRVYDDRDFEVVDR